MNKKKLWKKFDTVKFFRAVKEQISKDTKGMSFKEYIDQRKLRLVK
jgi:hypothetical protein